MVDYKGNILKIEDNIPLPPKYATQLKKKEFEILKDLEVGQSVLFPSWQKSAQVGAYCSKIRQQYSLFDHVFATRKTDKGVRVWRTK